jgi:uncharacterized protein
LTEAIKLLSIIILIIILLRLRLDLGLVMFLSSIVLGFLFQLGCYGIINNIYLAVIDPNTLELVGIIVLVYILSGILRRTKSMDGIISSLLNIVADYRLILFIITSFLGLIPMPAGAMFSAPLLREIGEKNNMNAEEIMFANYWLRHIWEFMWPLYPVVLLYSSFIKVDVREIMILQFPFTIIALSIGFFWMYTHLDSNNNFKINYKDWKIQIFTFFKSVWSILLIIFLVLFLKINLLVSLGISIILLLIIKRISIKKIWEIFFQDVSFKVVIMIIGIMLFKQVLESTDSITQLPQFFSTIGINIWVVLFFIPFLIGSLTGVTISAIGVSFPILMPIMTQYGSLNLSMAMVAYIAGFTGMMISPMHLCLTVTIEYLKADILKFYKILSISLLVLIIISTLYIYLFI